VSNFERTKLTENEIAAWWAMFGPPPVLSSENSVGYDNLRNACVAYYRPTDARHRAWIRELVDTQWEILRHLRYRTAAIEWSHKKWIHDAGPTRPSETKGRDSRPFTLRW
jgi:hypothetical protein